MIEIIQKNLGKIILGVILVVCMIVSSIITVKKSGGKVSFWEALKARIFENIPMWIDLVEKPGNGEAKKEAVLDLALNEAKAYLGRELTDKEKDAIKLLASSHLENVMHSTKAKSKKSKYRINKE